MAQLELSVSHLRKNMIISRAVYTNTGAILVSEGTPVTKEVISILTKHFIDTVFVEPIKAQNTALSPEEQANPFVDPGQLLEFKESFQVAEDTLAQNLLDIVDRDEDIDPSVLLYTLNEIVEKTDNETNLSNMLMLMKKNSTSLYQHSISVALFGQILAKWLYCTKEEIELISISGLLHDIGLLKSSKEKMAHFYFHNLLTNADNGRHAIEGHNAIRSKHIDNHVKHAILTHHERLDGSGVPLNASHFDINQISRILAVVDTYDILTMEEDGFGALSPFQALQRMEDTSYGKLDPHIMLTFLSNIADTMIQHRVLLSNGQDGRIIMINKYDISRPLVQMGGTFIDLSQNKELYIKKVLD